jgi:NAD(P)-dependent dehydrogenase (short-subunit alcohol dehydrogenase family)
LVTSVVTGAASGIGNAVATRLAEEGMKVVLADIEEGPLADAEKKLADTGATVLAVPTDVTKAEQVDALAAKTFETFGTAHVIHNNAGVATGGPMWTLTEADWQWVLGVNLWGVIHGVRAFTPLMLAAAQADPGYRGHIVNTASMAGLLNQPNLGAYNVAKHAVVSLSETLFHDLSLVTGQVHCSVLCPYFIPTGIHQSHRNRPADLANPGPPTRSQLIAQAMVSKAVSSGKLTAAAMAERTFDAIRAQAFYIVSHPDALDAVLQGAQDLVALRNPADPFASRPEQRSQLEAALRG